MRGIRELLNITGNRERTRTVICSAIRSRRLIEFFYHGGYRTVEPFCLGLVLSGDADNNESLLCFQTGGFSELREVVGWKLYRASEMEDIDVLNETFLGDRPGYDPDAVEMYKIYCCVTPVAGNKVAEPEPIEELPCYEVTDIIEEETPEPEPLPCPEAAPEEKPRYLTHSELMKTFRFGHGIPISGVTPDPSPESPPEGTEWEFRHYTQMFRHLNLLGQNA